MSFFDIFRRRKSSETISPKEASLGVTLVNGKPFLGRVEEQKQFRAALNEMLNPPKNEKLPYIFMLYGDGGIGKTTLAKRFRSIATDDENFKAKFEIMWVDWEDEQKKYAPLQVGREYISPESVFDVIFTVAQRNEWDKYFSAYKDAIKQRKQAEKKAAEALAPVGERDEFAQLRGLGASTIAGIIRTGAPIIGKTGEELATVFLDAGIKVGAEQAYALRTSLETRLRARLGVEQFDLYVNPNESLARSLADGLKRAASRKPLLIFLDTYEIIDRADIWLRTTMQTAGSNILWVIAGRNNLVNSRRFGNQHFKGYSADFSSRFVAYDMRQLALDDVKTYFATCVTERPLDEPEAEAIRRATHGIPLAIEQAAEMWAKGLALEKIVGDVTDATPQKEIVAQMTERYLLHVRDEDKTALYALALAHGDIEVLREMLRRNDDKNFQLDSVLQKLERDYASVYAGENRLHDEPASFILSYLREPVRATSDNVRELLNRAIVVLQERILDIENDIILIEERCDDDDWVRAVLGLTDYLFWRDEEEAWRWFIPRFVESLAYSRELRQGLVEAVSFGQNFLTKRGSKRLKFLQAMIERRDAIDEDREILDELEHLAQQNWLAGNGEEERKAILMLRRGQQFFNQRQYQKALACYEQVERYLPPNGKALKTTLGNGLNDLSREFLWPENRTDAIYSPEAEKILERAARFIPDQSGMWYQLGVAHKSVGKNEQAIAAYNKAIELDPKDAYPWNGLGIVYDTLNQIDKALAAYNKAIELDPKFASPWNGVGNIYHTLNQTDKALEAYSKSVELDPNFAYPWNGLGNVYDKLNQSDKALEAYNRAIELDPKYASPWNGVGNVYNTLNQTDKALEAYNKAMELDPKFAYPWNGVGNIHHTLNQTDKAIEAYNKAIELDPKFAYPWSGLGNVYDKLNQTDKALEAYNRAMELDPKFASPWSGLGDLYEKLNQTDKALEAYNKAIELDPKFASPWNGLGDLYGKLNQTDKAIEAYNKAIELDLKDGYAWHQLGMLFSRVSENQKALQNFKKAVDLKPDNGAYRGSYARMLKVLGEKEEAEKEIEITRALIVKEDTYNRACFEAICGNVEEALQLLRIALEKNEIDTHWVRQDPDFENLRDNPRFKDLMDEFDKKETTG